MSPSIAASGQSVQPVSSVAPERSRPGARPVSDLAPSGGGEASASAIVSIRPQARGRSIADAADGQGTAQSDQASVNESASRNGRQALNVAAALRAYESNRPVGSAGVPAPLQRGSVEQVDNRASVSRDDPADDTAQDRPARASSSESRDLDEVARERQQRDAEASLQGSANQALRLGNQSAGAAAG